MDVAKYTLASYAVIKWSNVIVKYELQDKSRTKEFESYVKSLFPKAIIIRGRSDNQQKFKDSIRLIQSLKDDWVFVSVNADHPFMASETKPLYECLKQAKKMKRQHKFVSVYYSHYGEARSWITPESCLYDNKVIQVENNEYCDTVMFPNEHPHEFFDSLQIVHTDTLKYWFMSKLPEGMRIIRPESVLHELESPERVMIVPKREICQHFDGYSHVMFKVPVNPDDIFPPLFIPHGFFEDNIRVAFGYRSYRKGWVNANPLVGKYKFQDRNGIDIKLIPDKLPLFWKSRIKVIDVNPKVAVDMMQRAWQADIDRRASPWKCGELGRTAQNIRTTALTLNHLVKNPHLLAPIHKEDSTIKVIRKRITKPVFELAHVVFYKRG